MATYRHLKRIVLGVSAVVFLMFLGTAAILIRNANDDFGPCGLISSDEKVEGVTRGEWSWSHLGFKCTRQFNDGRKVVTYVR